MSFILDALRKSDKKRQESTAPGLDTVHEPAPAADRSRPLWSYLLVAVLLLNVGLLVWFFSAEPRAPVADVNIVQQQPAIEAVAPLPVVKSPPPTVKPPVPQVVTSEPLRQTNQSVPPEPNRPPTERSVYALSELPVAVQRRIPALHMSLHAYGNEAGFAGMVRVNEQILRAGSELEGNLLLEEIRADGAVFRFEGYRFLLPRN